MNPNSSSKEQVVKKEQRQQYSTAAIIGFVPALVVQYLLENKNHKRERKLPDKQ
jgi:predicted transcriptional regulator